uniref:Uncharacterized protein n=1 Tax=Meloidogyne hapla TaxID=6305 RepID=A0A1I8BUX8_MELHA
MLAETCVIIFHPFIRRDITQLLKKIFTKNRISDSSTNMTIYLKKENEAVDHIKMLANSWEKKALNNNNNIIIVNKYNVYK